MLSTTLIFRDLNLLYLASHPLMWLQCHENTNTSHQVFILLASRLNDHTYLTDYIYSTSCCSLLDYDTMQFCNLVSVFRRNITDPIFSNHNMNRHTVKISNLILYKTSSIYWRLTEMVEQPRRETSKSMLVMHIPSFERFHKCTTMSYGWEIKLLQ
jgi:hypothetical protein